MLAQMGQQAPVKEKREPRRGEEPVWTADTPTKEAAAQHPQWLHSIAALTGWGDGLAARGGERRAGHQAAGGVRGRVSEGPHGVTGAHVVHGHAVGEGVAHRVVGLAVVAADLLRFPAGVLGGPHQTRLAW